MLQSALCVEAERQQVLTTTSAVLGISAAGSGLVKAACGICPVVVGLRRHTVRLGHRLADRPRAVLTEARTRYCGLGHRRR